MAIKLEIKPSSTSLDLLGPPDPSSAYSLSGHISLSLASSHSLFERRRAVRILLRSLVITFEGQAELIMNDTGYTAFRLCSISKELVSKTTVELGNEGLEDGEEPCTWHVMFDLPIPGWLPASDQYGDSRQGFSGTQYNLYATMKFTNAEEATLGPSWISALCTTFSSRSKVVHAERCGITLNRFALPPPCSVSHNPTFYSVTPNAKALNPGDNPHPIPADIISKVQLLASVPERISLDEEKIPFALSIRTSSLSESQAAELRVSHVSLELQQVDEYTSSASAYAERHPAPSQREQPPNKALREAHPVHTLYDIGLLAQPLPFTFEDAHSLLPGCKRVDIPFDSADHARKCAEGLHPKRWFTIEAQVPFIRPLPQHKEDLEWVGMPRLRETAQSPFFSVRHSLRVNVALSYHGAHDNGEPTPTSFLAFSLPLNFVRLHRKYPQSSPDASPLSEASDLPPTIPPSQHYHLPAYSQLFYPNGDARHDDSIPLPRYTPSPAPLPTSGGDSEDGHSTSESSCLLPSPPSSNPHSLSFAARVVL